MFFLELAAQSVRGFSPSVRAALKPGYLALKSPTELPAPLAGLILSLAYPDGRGGDAAFLAPGAKSGRAGLSIQGNDGSVWRLVRDLGGAGGLHKLNRATNQFEAVSQDAQEMSQALRQGAGFVARTTWEQLFTLTGPQLPTRRPRGPRPAAAAPAPEKPRLASSNSWVGLEPVAAPGDSAARVAELEQELKVARQAAELQFKLDGITADIYTVETKVKGYEDLKAKLLAARAELASAPTPKSIGAPDDIVERAKRYAEDKKRYSQALRKLYDERDQALGSAATSVEPIYKNQTFLLAAGGALLLLILAAVLEGGLRYLSLLSILPFSFAALLALRWVEELQHAGREGAKGEVFAQREKRLTDEFKLASTVVEAAFEKVGAITTDEFVTAMAKVETLRPSVAQLELEFADFESDPEIERLPAQLAQLKADQERLNEELLSMSGGYMRDVREIERELGSLKAPGATPARSTSGEFAALPTGPTETFEDPTPALLVLATDLFTTDVPSLWSVLRDRVVQYLTALTDRRYHGVDVSPDGHATLQAPGREVKAGELPGKDLDLYFLALRLTLIEKASAQSKQPVIIEDTFNTVLDAAKQPLFGRMVKHLGSLTQVLHVSGAGQNAALADTPVAI